MPSPSRRNGSVRRTCARSDRPPPFFGGRARVGLADGVRDVEQQVVRDAPRRPPVVVERHHQVDELDRHRRRAQQDVALAGDRDGSVLGPEGLAAEIALDVVLRAPEQGREGLRHPHRAAAGFAASARHDSAVSAPAARLRRSGHRFGGARTVYPVQARGPFCGGAHPAERPLASAPHPRQMRASRNHARTAGACVHGRGRLEGDMQWCGASLPAAIASLAVAASAPDARGLDMSDGLDASAFGPRASSPPRLTLTFVDCAELPAEMLAAVHGDGGADRGPGRRGRDPHAAPGRRARSGRADAHRDEHLRARAPFGDGRCSAAARSGRSRLPGERGGRGAAGRPGTGGASANARPSRGPWARGRWFHLVCPGGGTTAGPDGGRARQRYRDRIGDSVHPRAAARGCSLPGALEVARSRGARPDAAQAAGHGP